MSFVDLYFFKHFQAEIIINLRYMYTLSISNPSYDTVGFIGWTLLLVLLLIQMLTSIRIYLRLLPTYIFINIRKTHNKLIFMSQMPTRLIGV